MIIEIFPSGPLDTNAYLVACNKTKKGVVMDPSLGSGKLILKRAAEEGIQLEKILLTHSHFDHIADVAFLKKSGILDIYVHREDAPNMLSPGADGLPDFFEIEGAQDIKFLEEGQKILIGELECVVLHTPGHSPGSVVFYFEKEGVLFSGDTLFAGSIGRLDLPTGQQERMWPSLKKLGHLPKNTKVYPGHGETTTIGKEQWLNHAEEVFG